jgi:hypothetical protein
MPAIARPRATPTQPSCDRGTELQYPAPHRFVGNVEPSVGKQFLDIAVAQGEAEIKPDRVLDDLGREVMAAVAERRHVDILPDTPLAPDPVSVTMPEPLFLTRLLDAQAERCPPFRVFFALTFSDAFAADHPNDIALSDHNTHIT